MNELILEDQFEILSSEKKETINSIHDILSLSSNYVSPLSYTDYSPKEENADGIYATSDSLILQQQQQNTRISNKDYKYRIHIGTQPGYCAEGDIAFTESQKLHSKIIDFLERFLSCFKITHEFIKKDAFSISAWGLEPYACLLLSCSDEIAKGLAAIIGLALRQDAIGIYTTNNDGYAHPVFTVSTSDDSLFTKFDAILLMKRITKDCKCLSAQFDENGRSIEFHDFENINDKSVSIESIRTIINRYFGIENSLRITENIGQSDLLEKKDYQNAIKQAGFEVLGAAIELTLVHDDSYDKFKCT